MPFRYLDRVKVQYQNGFILEGKVIGFTNFMTGNTELPMLIIELKEPILKNGQYSRAIVVNESEVDFI